MARNALVTGGTRGIGKGVALALQDAGYNVCVTYHSNEDTAQAFTKDTAIKTYRFDVADETASREAMTQIENECGPIDVVVHNAGLGTQQFFHKMSGDSWRRLIDVNLNSCYNVLNPILHGMRERRFGRIIIMSSIGAEIQDYGQSAYCAAKAGVVSLARVLARENGSKNITVNTILPGYIDTDMLAQAPAEYIAQYVQKTAVGRLGTPADIARGVVFLAADEADFVTGSALHITGGLELFI